MCLTLGPDNTKLFCVGDDLALGVTEMEKTQSENMPVTQGTASPHISEDNTTGVQSSSISTEAQSSSLPFTSKAVTKQSVTEGQTRYSFTELLRDLVQPVGLSKPRKRKSVQHAVVVTSSPYKSTVEALKAEMSKRDVKKQVKGKKRKTPEKKKSMM